MRLELTSKKATFRMETSGNRGCGRVKHTKQRSGQPETLSTAVKVLLFRKEDKHMEGKLRSPKVHLCGEKNKKLNTVAKLATLTAIL